MALDTSTASNILKRRYEAPIRKWLNNSSFLLSKIKRNTKDFVGQDAYIPVHKGRNVGVGARAEGAALPIPGNQQYDKLIYTVVYLYGTMRLTRPVIAAAKNNTGSFARAVDSEMKGLAKDCNQDVQRQVWRDGSGCLTKCGVTSGSTTVVVNSTKYIQPGMIVDMRDLTDGSAVTDGTGVTVLTVPSSTTFTVTTAVTTAATDGVFKTGSRDGSAWATVKNEMWGLQALIHDDDINDETGLTVKVGQLARVGNTLWQANVLDNSGTPRALSVDLMQQAFDKCDIAVGKTPGAILTNHALVRKYGTLLTPDRRYTGGGLVTFDGGWKGLEFNGIPVLPDKDAGLAETPDTLQRMYFLDLSAFELHQLEDWHWAQDDGAILKQAVGTISSGSYSYAGLVDAVEAIYAAYQELGIDTAVSHCLLDDITES
jgi:hypothetical protein